MMVIQILDKSVIEHIAAGEVVERPANIVKELVENSIDAGATEILVEIEKGGVQKILVKDNGCGMTKDDLKLSIVRHATSKITTLDDLSRVSTLGFRGEALASMCAVSRISIKSKQDGKVSGNEIVVEGGQLLTEESCAHDVGTTICIRDLFYNVPARLKFLRAQQTEFAHIADIISQYSILNPEVSFTLKHNGSVSIRSPAVKKLTDKVSQLYGISVAKGLIPISHTHESGIQVSGLISDPSQTRKDKNGITFFLNGRYIKNSELVQAVVSGYRTLLMIGRCPYAVIHMTVDPQNVDVNVHPRKDIVKFADENQFLQAIEEAVYQALEDKEFIRKPVFAETQDVLVSQSDEELIVDESENSQVQTPEPVLTQKTEYVVQEENTQVAEPQNALLYTSQKIQTNMETLPELTYVGILLKTYIVCQSQKDIVLIDFHAAHERYLYEKFKQQYENKDVQTQSILDPYILQVSPSLISRLDVHQDFLQSIGIDASQFGESQIMVRKVPVIAKKQLTRDLIQQILEELPDSVIDKSETLYKFTDHIFATMGCRAAYKAGDDIPSELAKKIIKWLLTSEQRFACPHGRPIFVQLGSYELEKMFKRKV